MKSVAIFNNKGGVGKTTLTYHAACALAELGHKTLLVDLDPQSSLTLYGASENEIDETWKAEDTFIDDFQKTRSISSELEFSKLLSNVRSTHFLLKPTEDGTADIAVLPPPKWLGENLALIPGRLSLHMYEDRIAGRWSDAYRGDPLAIRTIMGFRKLCENYAQHFGFEFALVDTSPSLGIMNKVIISTLDGFMIPCAPDIFSLYGIANIGRSLQRWKLEFETMYQLLSASKREGFPNSFVRFLGFSIYNARKYTGQNELDLASAHYNYAEKIPETIETFISEDVRGHLTHEQIKQPVGGRDIMHSHSTLPNMAQKYKAPIWKVPEAPNLDKDDRPTISGNRGRYEETKQVYNAFAVELLRRMNALD